MKLNLQKKRHQSNHFQKCKIKILEMAYEAGSNSSHFGGALSIVEIISTLFFFIR